MADALAHAHARLIVHRDVKPANIILTPDRGPVLVDFGLGLDEAGAGGSELGVISGTPAYMAPEQVAGTAHRIDGRTDIYSLGVVLYEMLCGRLPFRASNIRRAAAAGARRRAAAPAPARPRDPARAGAGLPEGAGEAAAGPLHHRGRLRRGPAARVPVRRGTGRLAVVPAISAVEYRRASSHPAPAASSQRAPSTSSSSRRRAREAERRQVTVLVCGCDLFESEAYLEDLDAEDQAKVLRAFQQACEQAVRRFDGTVVQCNEQGLLACFGYPVAYEDAARRAARAGLGLLEDMKALGERLRREHELELNPWVGIHTGPAVVEAGEDAVSLVGEARNVAVRLEDVAAPGQVVCTAATHRLIQGQFDCTSLGRRKIKGVAQPVELFRVQGVGAARNPIEAAGPAGLTPLTGRDHEISLLKDRWEQAQEGMGQVVLLIGEPGLGKSRLVHTLKEHVLGQMVEGEVDAPVIEWRCSPHFQNTGLYPAIDFYERALGFGREEPPQARFDRLLHRLEQYDLARPETVPLWASLLSLPTPDRFPPLSLVPGPAAGRDVPGHAGVAARARRPAGRSCSSSRTCTGWTRPPWSSWGSSSPRACTTRILTLLTFRPEFQTPWPAVAHQTSLALNRLTRRQVGDLMRKKAGGALPEALIEQIYDRTGGVPLFVEEFTKMVQESGVLDAGGGRQHAGQALLGARDPRHAPGPGDGPPGPDGGRPGGGPARRGARPRVQLRAARRRRDRGRADAPGRAGQAGAGGDPVPEGPAAPLHLHLQARPPRRRAVQRAGQGQAAAVPPADRRGAGGAVPADRRDAAGAAGATTSPRRA